ncbi:MAG: RdgB/HAM1 family non-canonical purine NTP pyrophosphatase [Candidatus Lokiarchaeota archaeon]|nr:RdgB/HAM1 family non-canonical purine NTP pyrophosphatase [Candidatus Lokiarchaeota archaeon]
MSEDKLVLVTQNKHKLHELTPLFQKFDVAFQTSSLEKYEIRSNDTNEVALEAALRAFSSLNCPVVVDDTGLYIDALGGFPQAYPAFILDTIGIKGVLKLMRDVDLRQAKFVCAVGYADDSGVRTFIGEMHGTIAHEPQGEGGFGYDPIFIPSGDTRTYAEMAFDEKIAHSHRTAAFTRFLEWYTTDKA